MKRDLAKRQVTITAAKQIQQLVNDHLLDESHENHPRTPEVQDIMSLEPPPAETPEEEAALARMRTKARSLLGGLIYIVQVHPYSPNMLGNFGRLYGE